MVSVLELDS